MVMTCLGRRFIRTRSTFPIRYTGRSIRCTRGASMRHSTTPIRIRAAATRRLSVGASTYLKLLDRPAVPERSVYNECVLHEHQLARLPGTGRHDDLCIRWRRLFVEVCQLLPG